MTTKSKEKPVMVGPMLPGKRIISLDVLRGIAIMGILAANIQISSMIQLAEVNPTAYGDLTGLNYVVAMLTHILVTRKFWAIFNMLFGAGIVMMSENILSKGGNPAIRHYPRMFWLFVIGSIHHYLFYPGEILAYYAVAGLFAYFCRKLSPKKLLIYGLLFLFLDTSFGVMWQTTMNLRSEENLKLIEQMWQPNKENVEAELSRYRGPWGKDIVYRFKVRRWFIDKNFYIYSIWSVLGRMLLGMALFKWGILTAARRKKTFRILFYSCFGIGLAVATLAWVLHSLHGWNFKYSQILGYIITGWGGIILAVGYIAAIMLICMAGKLKNLADRFAAAGRMAFTNYLMQGVICSFIFYGYGFGLVGKVERVWQILIVFAVWIFQLWYSPLWLKRFRFGPVEWLWRSLTYWKLQPMKKTS